VKTRFGISTNGTYLKYLDKFTNLWIVETQDGCIRHFPAEEEADIFVGKYESQLPVKRIKSFQLN